MSGFGANPTTGTQGSLPTNQFPLSSVAVPGTASGNLTALEGGPASTDSNGNQTAPASMYVKDGADVNSGTTTDAAVTTDTTATMSAKLRGLVKISGDIWDSTNHRIRVDGSGVTQPISAASLPLPTGAATAAKQPALGTAGSASSDVITVQGIASMTPVKVDGSGVTQPVSGTITANAGTNLNTSALALDTSVNGVLVSQGSTTSGEKGPLVQGAVTTSAPSYTTAQTSPISLTTAGAVRVDASATTQPVSGTVTATQATGSNLHTVVDSGAITATTNADTTIGGTSAPSKGLLAIGKTNDGTPQYQPLPLTGSGVAVKVDASATTQPVSGTFWQATQPVSGTVSITANSAINVAQVGGTNTDTNSGNKSAGTQRVVLATDQPALTNALKVDGSGVTQPVSGTVTANVGTTNGLALDSSVNGVLVSQGSTTSGQSGPLIQGAVTTNAPSYTTAKTNPLSLDTSGLLRTSLKDTPSNTNNLNVNLAASAATVTVSAANLQTNINQIAGSAVGTAATGIMKVGVTDGSGTAITSTSSALDVNIKSGGGSGFSVVDEAAWTAGTSAFVPAGGVFNDSAAALTSGQEGTARLTNNRAIHVNLRDASANQLLGSKTSANSIPVVVASDQGAVAVSGTVTANQGGSNWSVNVAQVAGGNTSNAGQTGAMQVGGAVATNTVVSSATNPLLIAGSDYGGTPKVQSLKVDSSGNAQVAVTNTPTITANAGTNLNTSALALDTSVNGVLVSQGSTTSGQKGPLIQGAVTTNAPSYTTAQTSPLSLDTSGLLRASLKDTPSNTNNLNVNLAASAATVTVSGTVTANQGGSNWSTNVAQIGGTNVVTGGASGLLAIGGPVASGASNADNPVKIGGAFNTTQPTVTNGQVVDAQMTARGAQIVATGADTFNATINAALPAGGNTIGAVTQASGPWTSNVTQFGGNNVATGTGAGGSGIPRVTVSNDSEIQLWDGTTGPVAVKAAATSPVLADKAMVHVLSPNNTGLPVNLPTIVQSHSDKSSGSVASLAQAFTSNNIAGNSIIVVCAVGNNTAPTCADSNNTYTRAALVANGSAFEVAIFYAVNIAAGANTVTVTNAGSTASMALEIYEVSGLITQVTAQPDQTATNSGSSGTASTSTISAQSPNEFAFAGIGIGTGAQTITVGSGWTNDSGQQNPTTPAGLFSFVSMSQFLGSVTAVTPQATFTSEPWAIAAATFRPVVLGVEGTSKITDGITTMGFGSKTSANSMPIVVASDQGAVAIGVVSGTALTADQSNTILKSSLYVKKSANADTVLTLGSATSANSVPVVVASDQGSVPITTNTSTTGGSTPFHALSAASNNATNVKSSAGQLYGFSISNTIATARWFKLYDKASAPAPASDAVKQAFQIPGNSTVLRVFPEGLSFTSGISFAAVANISDTDNTSIAANDLSIDLNYK